MKRIPPTLPCLALLLLLFSCASSRQALPGATDPVSVTDKKKVALLPPSAIGQTLDIYQHITATFRGQELSCDTLLLADEHQLFITILNDFGTTIGSLTYNDEGASFESDMIPRKAKAEYIIFDIQLCFYRPEALEKQLAAAGLRFECVRTGTAGGEVETRTVYDGEQAVMRIEKRAGAISCTNMLRSYSYLLTGEY